MCLCISCSHSSASNTSFEILLWDRNCFSDSDERDDDFSPDNEYNAQNPNIQISSPTKERKGGKQVRCKDVMIFS